MKKLSITFILLLLVIIACKNTSSPNEEKEALKMYQYKPLALLMLDMHDENAMWKEAILADSFDIEYPDKFNGIYTLEATDSTVRTEEFEKLADTYLQSVNDLVNTKKNKKQIKRFNASIDACISCHAVYCQGPIDKISKLYIEK